jgi:hypothetical protein
VHACEREGERKRERREEGGERKRERREDIRCLLI